MDTDEPKAAPSATVTSEVQGKAEAGEQSGSSSRLERLKKKLTRLQGMNPDIYPMW